jgi:hypothetical protein
VLREREREREKRNFSYVFNDALTIELNFNGKTRLGVLIFGFRFPGVAKQRREKKLHAVTKNRAFS